MGSVWDTDISFLYAAADVLLGGLCIAIIARALWTPLDVYRGTCCGGCSHPVSQGGSATAGGPAALLEGRCPECGGLYARVGISTPPMAIRLRGSLSLALVAWLTLCVTGASYLSGWLQRRAWAAFSATSATYSGGMSGKMNESSKTDFVPSNWGNGNPFSRSASTSEDAGPKSLASALDFRISLATDMVTDNGKVESGTATLGLRRNGTSEVYTLVINVPDGDFKLTDAADKQIASGKTVDAAVIDQWFEAAKLKSDLAPVRRSMQDALKITNYVVKDPDGLNHLGMGGGNVETGQLQSGGRSSSSSGPVGGGMPAPAMPTGPGMRDMVVTYSVITGVFLVGCVVITVRHRKLVRAGMNLGH